jgi:hypothetical protein
MDGGKLSANLVEKLVSVFIAHRVVPKLQRFRSQLVVDIGILFFTNIYNLIKPLIGLHFIPQSFFDFLGCWIVVNEKPEFAVAIFLIELGEQNKVVPHLIDKDEVIIDYQARHTMPHSSLLASQGKEPYPFFVSRNICSASWWGIS